MARRLSRAKPCGPITLRAFQRWVRLEPRNPVARAVLGRALSLVARDVDACLEWREAIRLWRGRAPDAIAALWELVGEAAERLGDRGESQRAFRSAAYYYSSARRTAPRARSLRAYRHDLAMREAHCLLRRGEFARAAALARLVVKGPFARDLHARRFLRQVRDARRLTGDCSGRPVSLLPRGCR